MDYTEKDLEDWVCENIDQVVRPDSEGRTRLVGRQMEVPGGGILDVLTITVAPMDHYRYKSQAYFTVIELKREKVDEAAVAQALRYRGSLDEVVPDLMSSYHDRGCHVWSEALVAAPHITSNAALAVQGAGEAVHYLHLQPTLSVEARTWWSIDVGSVTSEQLFALAGRLDQQLESHDVEATTRLGEAKQLVQITRPDLHPIGHRGFVPTRSHRMIDYEGMWEYEAEINALIRYDPDLSNGRPYLLPAGDAGE